MKSCDRGGLAAIFKDGYSPCPSQSQMGQEPPVEARKLIFVSAFLLASALSNWAALAYIHDVVGMDPLPDVIFSIIPQQAWALKLGDSMVTLCSLSMILLVVFHKYRHVIIRRVFFMTGVLYSLRTLSMLFTQLPAGYSDNLERCRAQLNITDRTWEVYLQRLLEQTIHIGFQDIEDKMLCGDLLFSGHTLMMVMSALTVNYYLPENRKILGVFPWMFSIVGMICMVISRTHYSIDVLFAYLLVVFVFSLYHAFCEIEIYRDRRSSVLSHLLIIKIAMWLETNVLPGKLDPAFAIPCRDRFNRIFRARPTEPSTLNNSSSTIEQTV